MYVPALNNNFAGTNLYESFPYKGTLSNGYPTSGSVKLKLGRSQRTGKTKNSIIDLNGFKYRKDSDYLRLCHTYTHYEGDIRLSSGATRRGYFSRVEAESDYLFTHPFTLDGSDVALTNERNQAITECLLKLKEDKVQLGQLLAEAVQSVNMLADAASGLFRFLLAVKRKNIKTLRRSALGLEEARMYLRWKYGWQPLCSDLHSLYEDARSKTKPRPLVLKATRQISSNYASYKDTSYWINRQQQVKGRNTCQIMAKVKDSFLASANSYGLINPLSLGWELVPYSFVVDWAMPIGNFLEALSAPAGLDFLTGFTGQSLEGTIEADRIYSGASGKLQRTEVSAKIYRRQKLTTWPLPMVYVKSPFRTGNVLSALALLRQLR